MTPFLVLSLLVACGTKVELPAGEATELPTATGAETDTGVAWLFWYAELETTAGELSLGNFGLQARYVPDAFYAPDVAASQPVCSALSAMTTATPATAVCADCVWQFSVTLAETSVAGSDCGSIPGMNAVDLEGQQWGFGYQASYSSYGPALMMYDPSDSGAGWWPFFVAAPAGGNMLSGDAANIEGFRAIYNDYYYAPYYYVVSTLGL